MTQVLYLLFVAHNLERIGDRATNICERIPFLTTGTVEEVSSDPKLFSVVPVERRQGR